MVEEDLLESVGSLLPLPGSWGSNTSNQTWKQAPLPIKPTCWTVLFRIVQSNRIYRMKQSESPPLYIWDGQKWCPGCSPANPTMAAYEEKVEESSSFSVYEARCLRWSSLFTKNPKKVDSNTSGEMDLLVRQGRTGKEQNLSSISSYRFPAEGIA